MVVGKRGKRTVTMRPPARREAYIPARPSRETDSPARREPQQVPKVVRDATDRFIKKYSRTLRDLEKY